MQRRVLGIVVHQGKTTDVDEEAAGLLGLGEDAEDLFAQLQRRRADVGAMCTRDLLRK